MKYLIIITIFFFSLTYAQDLTLTPDQDLPIELKYLLETYNELSYSDWEKEKLTNHFDKISENILSIDKAQKYLLLKSEIYKAILQFPPVPKKSLKNLPSYAEVSTQYKSKFFTWIAMAINEDFQALKEDTNYKTLQGKNLRLESLSQNQKVFIKKLERIQPWMDLFANYNEEEARDKLKAFVFATLEKLEFYSKTFIVYSKPLEALKEKQLIYKLEKDLAPKPKEETLSEILSIKEKPPTNLQATQNVSTLGEENLNWVPKDEPQDLFPKPDPNYQPPAELPQPVNDWIFDL